MWPEAARGWDGSAAQAQSGEAGRAPLCGGFDALEQCRRGARARRCLQRRSCAQLAADGARAAGRTGQACLTHQASRWRAYAAPAFRAEQATCRQVLRAYAANAPGRHRKLPKEILANTRLLPAGRAGRHQSEARGAVLTRPRSRANFSAGESPRRGGDKARGPATPHSAASGKQARQVGRGRADARLGQPMLRNERHALCIWQPSTSAAAPYACRTESQATVGSRRQACGPKNPATPCERQQLRRCERPAPAGGGGARNQRPQQAP